MILTWVDKRLWTEQPEWAGGSGKKDNAPPTAMETEPGGVPFPRGWNPRSLIVLVAPKKLRQEAMGWGMVVREESRGITPSLSQS